MRYRVGQRIGQTRSDQRDIAPAGVTHMIPALSDAHLVEFFSGERAANVPDINGQLRLVAER